MASEVGNDFNNLLSIILGLTPRFCRIPRSIPTARPPPSTASRRPSRARPTSSSRRSPLLAQDRAHLQRANMGLIVENFCQMIGDSYGRQLTLLRSAEPALASGRDRSLPNQPPFAEPVPEIARSSPAPAAASNLRFRRWPARSSRKSSKTPANPNMFFCAFD